MTSIILNEKDYAANLLTMGTLSTKPLADADILARYYYAKGLNAKQVKEQVSRFLSDNLSGYNRVLWDDVLTETVNHAKGTPLLELDYIEITQQELDTIAELHSKKLERLLFTLLCLAKYGNARSVLNNDWVSVRRYKQTGIFNLAKVAENEMGRCLCIKQLRDAGMLEYSKAVDNINVRVTCVDHGGKAVALVRDMDNLGHEYRRLRGEPYFECSECGHLTKRRSNAQKYCPACAKMIHTASK